MVVLAPVALILVVALPATILLVHLLRGRSRQVRVPAIFLWADLPPAASGLNRLRRPPLSMLLVLQLLAAAALALALTRPGIHAGHQTRHLAIVLDASASMQATDVQPTRFDAARAEALHRLDQLSASDRVTLVRAGASATLLAEGTRTQVRPALLAAQPGAGTAALRDGIALAEQQIAATPQEAGAVVVLTDGAFAPLDPIGALAAPVEFVPVRAATGDNQAVVTMAVRSQPSGHGREAYVQLTNLADHPVQSPLRVLDPEGGQLVATRQVDLPARGTTGLVVALPDSLSRLEVQLDTGDSLALDDRAEVPVPGARVSDVFLVSAAPAVMQHVLEAIPSVRLRVVKPDELDLPNGGADLTVLDGVMPDPLPSGPLLIVNPPARNPLLQTTNVPTTPGTTLDQAHPLLAGVDVAALNLGRSPAIAVPTWARPLVSNGRGGLVLDGRYDGRQIVVFAFDPTKEGRDKSLAFPLLTSNAVSYLLAGSDGRAIAPGQSITLPAPPSGQAVVMRPDGSHERITATGNKLTVSDTEQVGRYRVVDPRDPGTVLTTFAVNLLDPVASDIRPRADLAPLPANVALGPARQVVDEWWRLLVAAGVALLGVEWLVFARRG